VLILPKLLEMKFSKLLFYLDDDPDDLKYFKEVAEKLGHRVSIFANCSDMFYALKHQLEKPAMIFLDVHMPVLNGEAILNLIKKSVNKHIPIVMISGIYPEKMMTNYLNIGADHLMEKPVTDDLVLVLQQVLEFDFKSDPNVFYVR
jgi:CheY-like chemotaxis protein